MKKLILKSFTPLLISTLVLAAIPINPLSAINFCTSKKCKQSQKQEQEAEQKAKDALSKANSLSEVIKQLDAEVSILEAKIRTNQATAEDLKQQITEKEQKLNQQQTALASLLIDLHFEQQPDPILLLAGSTSLSDLTEKHSRIDAVKSKVNLSTQTIKKLKQQLSERKAAVDRMLAEQSHQKSVINAKRAQQNDLMHRYRYNAYAYTKEAEAARKIKEKEIADAIARYNNVGIVDFGTNSYPYRNNCPRDNLRYMDEYYYQGQLAGRWGLVCQCTSYAGWKAFERWRTPIFFWGDAKYWDDVAKNLGYTVNSTPKPNTIAVSKNGPYGHVMWVEQVNSNGTINLSEYNNPYSSAGGRWGDIGFRKNVPIYGLKFIHFSN